MTGERLDLVHLMAAIDRRRRPVGEDRRARLVRLAAVPIPLPVLLARPDGSELSVIARSSKRHGMVQRTLFTRGLGPSTDDQHRDAAGAIARAWCLGHSVLTAQRDIVAYMPTRPPGQPLEFNQ